MPLCNFICGKFLMQSVWPAYQLACVSLWVFLITLHWLNCSTEQGYIQIVLWGLTFNVLYIILFHQNIRHISVSLCHKMHEQQIYHARMQHYATYDFYSFISSEFSSSLLHNLGSKWSCVWCPPVWALHTWSTLWTLPQIVFCPSNKVMWNFL